MKKEHIYVIYYVGSSPFFISTAIQRHTKEKSRVHFNIEDFITAPWKMEDCQCSLKHQPNDDFMNKS